MQLARTVLAMSLMVTAIFSRAGEWPAVEVPPQSRASWVADDMKYNNVPMRIKQFRSELGVAEVLAFYRQQWSEDGKKQYVENTLREWKIIGKQIDGHYVTVQVKAGAGGGSEGFIGASKLPSMTGRPQVDETFPRLAGTDVMSDIESNDAGKAARTLIFKNDHSVQSNASFYAATLPTQEWRQNTSHAGPQNNGNAHVLYFERRKESTHIVINRNPKGGSMIVVNIVATGL
jgi:hypothetical protein